jgi:hypothetical protein
MNHAFKPVIDGIRGANVQPKIEQQRCVQCREMHDPWQYLGRERWICSDTCFDNWMQFGRYEREWEKPE